MKERLLEVIHFGCDTIRGDDDGIAIPHSNHLNFTGSSLLTSSDRERPYTGSFGTIAAG